MKFLLRNGICVITLKANVLALFIMGGARKVLQISNDNLNLIKHVSLSQRLVSILSKLGLYLVQCERCTAMQTYEIQILSCF